MASAPEFHYDVEADLLGDLAHLLAEVERLRVLGPDTDARVTVEARAIAADMLQPVVAAWREKLAEAERERDESRAAEWAAIAAHLRECAMDPDATDAERRLLHEQAVTIERGGHRREAL